MSEADVAVLVSLLEGAVSMEACRSALEETNGNVDSAIQLLFGRAADAPPPATARGLVPGVRGMPPLALRPGEMIDLDDLPPVAMLLRGSSGASSSAPPPEVARGAVSRAGTAKTAARRAAAPKAVQPKTTASQGWKRSFDDFQGVMDEVTSWATAADASITKRPQKKKKANNGHLRDAWEQMKPNQPGDWQDISSDYINEPGEEWVSKMLEEDPPCLTLREHMPAEVGKAGESDGSLREAGSGAKWSKADIVLTKPFGVRTTKLAVAFHELLSKVRYPPEQLTLSWRLTEQPSSKKRCVPADLRGPLPSRPFKLLDNTGDTPARQPPGFGEHRLRPEQLRSLSWMLQREGHMEAFQNPSGGFDDQAADESAMPSTPWRSEEFSSNNGGNGSNGLFVTEWRSYTIIAGEHSTSVPEETACQLVVGARVKLAEDASGSSSSARVGTLIDRFGFGMTRVQWDDGMTTTHAAEALEFVDTGAITVGSLVQIYLKPSVKAPTFGWGGVPPSACGIVLSKAVAKDGHNVVTVRFPMHPTWKGRLDEVRRVDKNPKAHVIEIRAQASYRSRGGILADKIGYGKTATTIALIDSTKNLPSPPMQDHDRGCFFPAKGTLIIVPSNLLEQWMGEFSKFVWEGKPFRGRMKNGWSPKGSPLKIFSMATVTPLSKAMASDIADADVVICSYRLLFSDVYMNRRKQLSESDGLVDSRSMLSRLAKQTEKLMQGKAWAPSGKQKSTTEEAVVTKDWRTLQFPVLEQFHWRRIVFDEFHELESFESQQQNSLQHLRSTYRWGLTGTPPVESISGVIFMSSLFRVDLPGYLNKDGSKHPMLEEWESDRLMSDMAVEFLDTYVRQNTAELPHIRLEEHMMLVHHTPEERALYLGQAHDAPDLSAEDAFESEDNVRALERLLKLCSHFQASGDHAENAKQECARISEQKDRRVVRARNQMTRCSRVIALLQRKLSMANILAGLGPDGGEDGAAEAWREELKKEEERMAAEGDTGSKSAAVLAIMAQEAMTEPRLSAYEILDGHKPKDEELVKLLRPPPSKPSGSQFSMDSWQDLERETMERAAAERLLQKQAQEQAANLREHVEAVASLEFFKKTLAALARNDTPEARSCSVCMEDDLPLSKLAITPCAHSFCIDCLNGVVKKFQSCSLCRRKLTPKDICPLAAELSPAASAEAAAPSSSSGSPRSTPKYGTKLGALVAKLQDLRNKDPTAKVILFVQFDDLKRKVSVALEDSGVPTVQLQGSVTQRANIIRDWQENPASRAFVLLLSLAQSASGTNLTAASHVVFLHPMLAPTAERAVGHEMQAIGRARRHGQLRDTVHVWRFVTAGTVEEGITRRHQSALWEREQARAQQREG